MTLKPCNWGQKRFNKNTSQEGISLGYGEAGSGSNLNGDFCGHNGARKWQFIENIFLFDKSNITIYYGNFWKEIPGEKF